MKKRFLSLSAILGTSFLLLTGFDSAVTPESIMQDSMAAMQNVSSFDIDAGFDMVLNIEMITGSGEDAVPTSIGTGIGGNFGMKISEDMGMAMNMGMDVSAMGVTESMEMDMYAVPSVTVRRAGLWIEAFPLPPVIVTSMAYSPSSRESSVPASACAVNVHRLLNKIQMIPRRMKPIFFIDRKLLTLCL